MIKKIGLFFSLLWPIHRSESTKLLPMILLLFLLGFNQSVLWGLKDSITVTMAGAEVIPFIKLWAILPSVVLGAWFFNWLSNRVGFEKTFYYLIGSFLLLTSLFVFIGYPYREALHPTDAADAMEKMLPAGFKGLVSMFRYWTTTCFYVLCELWYTIIVHVLFWGFANRITLLSEASRFYGILSGTYNLAVISAGTGSLLIAGDFNPRIPLGSDAWEQTMMLLMIAMIASGLFAMGVVRWMHKKVTLTRDLPIDSEIEKAKFSFAEFFSVIGKSKYLICIAAIVIGFNLTINMFDVVWKDQVKKLYPAALDFNRYMNHLQIVQGFLAIVFSFGLAGCVKRFGWTKTALATPVFMLLTCAIFFSLLTFQDGLSGFFLTIAGLSPVSLLVFIGSVQSCMNKACRFSFFESTKEMAFVPLDEETKIKGKTAIDGIGARFGKSGASLLLQGLLVAFTTLSASAPYIGGFLLIVSLVWIGAVRNLGKKLAYRYKES